MHTIPGEYVPQGFWLMTESNPWPDAYIAIYFREETPIKTTLENDQKVFFKFGEALNLANALKEKYNLKQIRLFFPNQISIIVKAGRTKNHFSF